MSFNLRSKVILGLSLGIAAFSVHATAPSNDVQLFKNIRFGQTAEEILKDSAMAPCAQTNDADLMAVAPDGVCRKTELNFFGINGWKMAVQMLNGKAAQVMLFKASDYTEVQRVTASLMKSGYIGLAVDEDGKVLVDAIASLRANPKSDFARLFADAENQVTSKGTFNLGYSFYQVDTKDIQEAVKLGSLTNYLMNGASPKLRAVELRMVQDPDAVIAGRGKGMRRTGDGQQPSPCRMSGAVFAHTYKRKIGLGSTPQGLECFKTFFFIKIKD